ncbi:MAG: hypothetical protein GTO33_08600, partial [Acidobacteria bacterium]|nr:hypothetical protein [Acidobacteriota bacterium]
LSVFPMIGHTWGQQAVRFDDGEGMVCFPGDVMPTIHHAGPAFNMGYDVLPYENRKSKHALLDRAHREGWRLALDHEPDHPVVTVRPHPKHADRFTLEPAADV